MPVSKEKAFAIGASMLGIGTGVAATIAQKLMESGALKTDSQSLLYAGTAIGAGITVNLLSNVAQNVCSAFSKKVLVKHPDDLNHDLKKTLLKAVNKALNNVLILYKEQKPSKKNLQYSLDFVESVEDRLINILNELDTSSAYDKKIQIYILTPVEEAKTKILSSLQNELSNTDLPSGFTSLFRESFVDQLRLCFSEELKDKSNHTAWIAFQKMMLETTKSGIEDLLSLQKKLTERQIKIEEDLKKQRFNKQVKKMSALEINAVENLLREINQPARIQLQLNKALDELLKDIRQELGEIRQLVIDTRGDIKELRIEIKKERIYWWSRKMVVSYALIAFLIIAIIIIRNYYAGQPFAISVIVHGPKGIDDIVLKNRGTVVMNFGYKTEKQTLNENGEALFRQIPGKYVGDSILIIVTGLEGDPYKAVCDSCHFKLEPDKTFYLQLKPYGLDKISGVVVNEQGKPIQDATVMLQDLKTVTDENGFFVLSIPETKQKRLQDISVIKKGYKEETVLQVPPHVQSKPIEIQLQKN